MSDTKIHMIWSPGIRIFHQRMNGSANVALGLRINVDDLSKTDNANHFYGRLFIKICDPSLGLASDPDRKLDPDNLASPMLMPVVKL